MLGALRFSGFVGSERLEGDCPNITEGKRKQIVRYASERKVVALLGW